MLDEKLDKGEEREIDRDIVELAEGENTMEKRGTDEEFHVLAGRLEQCEKLKKLLALLGGELRTLGKSRGSDKNIVDTILPSSEFGDNIH